MKIADIILMKVDPVNKIFRAEVLGRKGETTLASIFPLQGSNDVEKITYLFYHGLELAMGIPLAEIKQYLQMQSTALEDYINNMPEEV